MGKDDTTIAAIDIFAKYYRLFSIVVLAVA